MMVGGCLHGRNNHLIPESEHESRNAGLSDVTALCGEHFEYVGTYRVSSYASLRQMDGMEEYLESEAGSLCEECLRLAVRHHGWPQTKEVDKVLFGSTDEEATP